MSEIDFQDIDCYLRPAGGQVDEWSCLIELQMEGSVG
jgi:hypothetical protein